MQNASGRAEPVHRGVRWHPVKDAALGRHELGWKAVLIGAIREDRRGRLVMETLIGGSRESDLPTGELVPRIC
jgi:hypothetical protein